MSKVLLALLLWGCPQSALSVPETPPPTPPETTPTPPATPPLITDEECIAKGGQVVTEQTYAYLDRRRDPSEVVHSFRICRVPSPRNGAECRGDEDCAGGRCFCTGDLGRPDPQRVPELQALDGTPGVGRCSDAPMASGSWWCLVSGGTVHLNGIIID